MIALGTILMLLAGSCSQPGNGWQSHEQRMRDFTELRFGMFICYNIMSYGASWGEANYDISVFDPGQLDCGQWADAAVSAGMKFGLLTTKHHEGFCLWDSEYTEYDVASTSYGNDIVREYVDAFRERGLKIGLYYSIGDNTHGVERDKPVGEKEMEFIKGQIRELLSNYGKVDYFVVDSWYWSVGHHSVPYHEIREMIRELQPECLLTDHTHLQAPFHVDIPYFEGPFGAFPEEDNIMASALGHCSVRGNGWFWSPATPDGLFPGESARSIVDKLESLESRYCNFMLNCMPNREGLLDTLYIDLLAEIGELWEPDAARPPLPPQPRYPVYSIPIEDTEASSGDPFHLIDACQIGTIHRHWHSDPVFPQEIMLDLGRIYDGINVMTIVPNHRCKPAPESALAEGNVTKCRLYAGKDPQELQVVFEGEWPPDALYRTLTFDPAPARYFKLEILEANGPVAIIAELDIGGSERMPE